jgi:uncharacterized OB-fold protein
MMDPAAVYAKPLPRPSPESRPFWDACHDGRLSLQRCADCAAFWFPPGPLCPECLSDRWAWEVASGRGTIFSFVVMHRVYHPGFAADVPYTVALIELSEGPRMVGNIAPRMGDQVSVGAAVQVEFERVTAEVSIPRWRPVGGAL